MIAWSLLALAESIETEMLREALNAETSRLLGVVLAATVFIVSVGGFLYARELRKLIAERTLAEKSQRDMIFELTRVSAETVKQQAEAVRSIGQVIEQNSAALNAFATALDETRRDVRLAGNETRAIIRTLATPEDVEKSEKRILSTLPETVNLAVAPVREGLSAIVRRVDGISDTLKTVEIMARGAATAEAVSAQIETVRQSVDHLRKEVQTVKSDVIEHMVSLCETPAVQGKSGEDKSDERIQRGDGV